MALEVQWLFSGANLNGAKCQNNTKHKEELVRSGDSILANL